MEERLYLLVLLYILAASTVNCSISARLFAKLRIGMALLMAVWPVTAMVPAAIELYFLQIRFHAGIKTTNLGVRWANVVILAAVTTFQLYILLRGAGKDRIRVDRRNR